MRQLRLIGNNAFPEIWDLLGEPFDSECAPVLVRASDYTEYVAKRNAVLDDGRVLPYVYQEWLCACLAGCIDLPTPRPQLLTRDAELWFGSEKLPVAAHQYRAEILAAVVNPDVIYKVAAFDVWIHNQDRHPGNFLVVRDGRALRLMAIDHTHCPLFGATPIGQLWHYADVPAAECVHDCYRLHITDWRKLRLAIELVQSVSDGDIASAAAPLPGLPWGSEDYDTLRRFLCYRRDRLLGLFNSSRSQFPALEDRLL